MGEVLSEMEKVRNKAGLLIILVCLVAVCITVSVLAQPALLMIAGCAYHGTGLQVISVTQDATQMSQFFDTGRPAKPYPSISGIHNGTLTPKATIGNVSTLYTYSCPGTGGHSEYVAFYNATTGVEIANGSWYGYGDDGCNISFPSFTMHANHTYKYSIRTGSYPWLIHNQTFTNEYGTINCTEFIDANGRSHVDMIPAIRLEGDFVPANMGYRNPKSAFSSYYDPTNITVVPSVPSYELPINKLADIENLRDIQSEFNFSTREEELLKTNGFVILDYGNETDIVAPYEDMKARDIPIFITADTMLHLYHIQFSTILKGIEEREFFDDLVNISSAMLEQSKADYVAFDDPEMKEAARRNVAYFAVALTLLQTPTESYNGSENITATNFTVPEYVKEEVEKEIEQIEEHAGFKPSVVFNTDPNCVCDLPCCYCEDYSQYVPRGHYTRSEKLKRYFKAMMWYGRMAFLLKGCNGNDALISEQDANTSTIQAALITSELPEVRIGATKTAEDTWNRIYAVTGFFVGKADDLTPYEYANALDNVFGTDFNASELSDTDKLLVLKAELAKMRSPAIYGGSGICVIEPPITEERLYECLDKTKGMRFMGQRFVPDSYMFQHLVFPTVGDYVGNGTPFTLCQTGVGRSTRCFPRGLDVMAVLGSEHAEAILIAEGDTEYVGENTSYDMQLNKLKAEFADVNTTEWNQNLYWSWLYTLKPLLSEFGDGYPTFMQTEAWQKKELQTVLASWTELRHDTILYAKQSYTPSETWIPPLKKGYVEPVPEFYARLLTLTQMTEKGLTDLDALNATEKARLQSLARVLERLITISVDELENKELSEDDYRFITNFGKNLNSTIAGVSAKDKETTIVADVHTDCSTGKVLEEGVGYVNLILVVYKVPDGTLYVGAGPVFSYYEFKQSMGDRLTDEAWKEMLKRTPPEEPEWVEGIMGR